MGLGLRHLRQSLEQQEGLHSGLSSGSSTYVPRVPLLINHSENALYGVLPKRRNMFRALKLNQTNSHYTWYSFRTTEPHFRKAAKYELPPRLQYRV